MFLITLLHYFRMRLKAASYYVISLGQANVQFFFNACALGRVDIFEGEPAKLDSHRSRIKEDGEWPSWTQWPNNRKNFLSTMQWEMKKEDVNRDMLKAVGQISFPSSWIIRSPSLKLKLTEKNKFLGIQSPWGTPSGKEKRGGKLWIGLVVFPKTQY